MNCRGYVFDEDGERICECGDEGRLCETCATREAAYWAGIFVAAPLSERDPEAYAEALREAGRGHLVQP